MALQKRKMNIRQKVLIVGAGVVLTGLATYGITAINEMSARNYEKLRPNEIQEVNERISALEKKYLSGMRGPDSLYIELNNFEAQEARSE